MPDTENEPFDEAPTPTASGSPQAHESGQPGWQQAPQSLGAQFAADDQGGGGDRRASQTQQFHTRQQDICAARSGPSPQGERWHEQAFDPRGSASANVGRPDSGGQLYGQPLQGQGQGQGGGQDNPDRYAQGAYAQPYAQQPYTQQPGAYGQPQQGHGRPQQGPGPYGHGQGPYGPPVHAQGRYGQVEQQPSPRVSAAAGGLGTLLGWGVVVSGLLAVIGCFGTWLYVSVNTGLGTLRASTNGLGMAATNFPGGSGTNSMSDGWFILVLALLVIFFGVLRALGKLPRKRTFIATALGVIISGIALYDFADASSTINGLEESSGSVNTLKAGTGWGLGLCIVAGLAIVVTSVVSALRD